MVQHWQPGAGIGGKEKSDKKDRKTGIKGPRHQGVEGKRLETGMLNFYTLYPLVPQSLPLRPGLLKTSATKTRRHKEKKN